MGLGGGETLTYTGAEVGEETTAAVHWTPFHFQVLPFEVYTCPTVGLGGKEYAIFVGHCINAFTLSTYDRFATQVREIQLGIFFPLVHLSNASSQG